MGRYPFKPKLHKKRLLTHRDFTVYTVNAKTVRDTADLTM